MPIKRYGQLKDETAMEYLKRIISALDWETTSLLDSLPSTEAIIEFYELWVTYDTDLWYGILEEIESGKDPNPTLDFIKKYKLPKGWRIDVQRALRNKQKDEHRVS
jgi:hypothetical protein